MAPCRICWTSYRRLPRTMLLAQRGWQFVKGGEGNCEKEALSKCLIYFYLTCGGSLDNMVTPLHNHQTGSMQIKPPLDGDSFRTDFNLHSSNQFRCWWDESDFTPHLHLWMQINVHYFCHTTHSSSVKSPKYAVNYAHPLMHTMCGYACMITNANYAQCYAGIIYASLLTNTPSISNIQPHPSTLQS